MKLAFFGLLAVTAAYAQRPAPAITFEAASVKVPPPRVLTGPTKMGCSGGPGTADPGRFACTNGMLSELVRRAFDLQSSQMVPGNMAGLMTGFSIAVGQTYQHGFDIEARIRAGATPDEFRAMLQNLLIDRFKLAYHFEKKDSDAYDLLIAKNGPKLKETEPQPASPSAQSRPAAGCLAVQGPSGSVAGVHGMGSTLCVAGTAAPMSEVAKCLGGMVGHTVTDATGLKGLYDVSLIITNDALEAPSGDGPLSSNGRSIGGGGTNIFSAIQDQLGLRLEKKKGSLDLFLIDHIEKTPAEN